MIVKTEATEVKVYRYSVTVIRTGIASLKEGRNTVYIAGMSKSSKKDSFTVKFPENVKAVNIQVVDSDNLEDGAKESEKIAEKIEEINYRISTCEMMMDLWKVNGNFSTRNDVSYDTQKQYLNDLPDKLFELRKQYNELNNEKKDLSKKLEEVSADEEKPFVMADIICDKEGEYPCILQYQESFGGWSPKYEVHYVGDDKPLDVFMKAIINQNSGEDWKQVKTTLYTGNPSVSHNIPELRTIKLSLIEVEKERARGGTKTMMPQADMMMAAAAPAGMNAMGMMMAAAAPMAALQTEEATVSEEETMTAFEIPGERDILNATDGNIVDLQSFKVEAKYHVLCIPAATDKAFMTATIKSEDWPFQAAKASIYLKDNFAGDVFVDPDSETGEFILSLGQDERINIIKKELLKKTQDVFLKKERKKTCEYEIDITNKYSDTVKVMVKDQIPVSEDKAIVVECKELSGGSVEGETGIITWEIDIESKNTQKLKLAYEINWPKDKKISETRSAASNVKRKFCLNCGAQIEPGLRFCPECGGKTE